MKYVLNDAGDPVTCDDTREWGKWFEKANRHVAKDQIGKKVAVSTVFLGFDHGYSESMPVLWETMVFGGNHDGYMARYTSREEALKGHKQILKEIKCVKKKGAMFL